MKYVCLCLEDESSGILESQRTQDEEEEMGKESIFTQDTNQLFAEKDSQCNPQVSRGLTWQPRLEAAYQYTHQQQDDTTRNIPSSNLRHNSPEVRYISPNTRYSTSPQQQYIKSDIASDLQQIQAIEQACPDGTLGQATWICTATGWQATGPDLSGCVSTWLTRLAAELGEGQTLNNVAMDLAMLTESQPLYGGDILEIIQLVKGMIRILETQLNSETNINDRRFLSEQLMENMVNIFNNMINKRELNAWYDLPSELRLASLSYIIEELEKVSLILGNNAESDFQFDLRTQNVAGAVRMLSTDFDLTDQVFSILDYPNTELKVVIPKGSLTPSNDRNKPTRIIVIQLNFPSDIPLKDHVLNSEVVSVSSDPDTMRYLQTNPGLDNREARHLRIKL